MDLNRQLYIIANGIEDFWDSVTPPMYHDFDKVNNLINNIFRRFSYDDKYTEYFTLRNKLHLASYIQKNISNLDVFSEYAAYLEELIQNCADTADVRYKADINNQLKYLLIRRLNQIGHYMEEFDGELEEGFYERNRELFEKLDRCLTDFEKRSYFKISKGYVNYIFSSAKSLLSAGDASCQNFDHYVSLCQHSDSLRFLKEYLQDAYLRDTISDKEIKRKYEKIGPMRFNISEALDRYHYIHAEAMFSEAEMDETSGALFDFFKKNYKGSGSFSIYMAGAKGAGFCSDEYYFKRIFRVLEDKRRVDGSMCMFENEFSAYTGFLCKQTDVNPDLRFYSAGISCLALEYRVRELFTDVEELFGSDFCEEDYKELKSTLCQTLNTCSRLCAYIKKITPANEEQEDILNKNFSLLKKYKNSLDDIHTAVTKIITAHVTLDIDKNNILLLPDKDLEI